MKYYEFTNNNVSDNVVVSLPTGIYLVNTVVIGSRRVNDFELYYIGGNVSANTYMHTKIIESISGAFTVTDTISNDLMKFTFKYKNGIAPIRSFVIRISN